MVSAGTCLLSFFGFDFSAFFFSIEFGFVFVDVEMISLLSPETAVPAFLISQICEQAFFRK